MLTQELILDMFFDLLNIKPPEWHKTFIEGRRLTSTYYSPLLRFGIAQSSGSVWQD